MQLRCKLLYCGKMHESAVEIKFAMLLQRPQNLYIAFAIVVADSYLEPVLYFLFDDLKLIVN